MALIYIVEDDESIGMLIQAALRAASYETRLMYNAAELERALEADTPALLLLDIMLPGKSGWAVLSDWKAQPKTRSIPVIILSAKSEELDKESSAFHLADLRIDMLKKEVRRGDEEIRLTRREMELLEYLCRHAGQVISREQLLCSIWDYHHEADTTRTVDYHIASLRQKLGGETQNRYIETVRGFGYRMRKE